MRVNNYLAYPGVQCIKRTALCRNSTELRHIAVASCYFIETALMKIIISIQYENDRIFFVLKHIAIAVSGHSIETTSTEILSIGK